MFSVAISGSFVYERLTLHLVCVELFYSFVELQTIFLHFLQIFIVLLTILLSVFS